MFKIKDAWQIVENTQGVQTWTDTRDGQQYRYKQFGTQIWMIDNWNYGGLPEDYVQISQSSSLGHAYRYGGVDDYQNWESEYGMKRGALYSADQSSYWGIPSGWHVATKSDWDTLISWANTEFPGFGVQALMAKTTFWCPNNPSSSVVFDNYNKSGFDLVPAGHASTMNRIYGGSDKSTNCIACFYTRTSSGYREFYTFTQNENSTPTASERSWDTGAWFVSSIRLVKDGGLPPAQPIITDIVTSLDSTGSDNKLATEKATRSAITSAVSSKMSNPMTNAYDLIIGGSSGAPTRLGAGSNGQVLTVNGGVVKWEDSLYSLGVETTNDTYMFYTQLEDMNTKAGAGYENKLKLLGMNNASVGNILSLQAGTPVDSGTIPQNEPYWRTESDVFLSGHPMTAFGDIMYAGATGSGGRRAVASLPAGTVGQVLGLEGISSFGAKPKWIDPELPSIENYSLSLTDSVQESASENENKVHFSKVYCHTTKKVSRMGFFHKSGTQGVFGFGIYNASGSALVTTAIAGLTSATEGDVCWVDLLGPVTLTRGTVYWFAFFTGWASGEWNTDIQFARNTTINGVGNTMIITYSLGSGTTSMPSSITSTTEGQFVPWIVAD